MQTKHDIWDASQYQRFGDERLRPAIDLLWHVPAMAATPTRIVDLGCGTGNLTAILKQRWPDAEVLGIDGSDSMLDAARQATPTCSFLRADIDAWAPDGPLDLIYSNSTLQWLGNHVELFQRLVSFLRPGGCLAVQMPLMHDAPLRVAQTELARSATYADALGQVPDRRSLLTREGYYDLLRPLAATLDIWETTYLHVLHGEDPVVQWASGTSLRPYLDKLEGERRTAFREEYAQRMRQAYPQRADGATLVPFRRLFLMVTV
ncbi:MULTISPECIES: methyltransferase domain-containing protein [unclassified Herbaspirillum]|uniref:methyltransferase domain-containing protein n=1 Tax=unclassified Herbaspirillum TaxID=2624150 RepID=UPI000E2EF1A9|nr:MULTISPECIES: methyltransferase domain-containing protein [unclassified Herbaspirillum]RFB67434.1 methyltransferase domain-containing protein [Herbaspirillum sp. 3R-3a1]TFI05039.1 methyltransferase domain-containing protein [Herbaspirillum sp. 3R11]TFI12630.1 methyltransferase domain-containing protein [Herbaspirillum sp. 3R-11]TFI22989.1 methyltransferase domain-containing protein [Herbaspirillum sp. 3C11]